MLSSQTTSNDSELISSSNSSTSSSSPLSHLPNSSKTMEDVWKEINIPSLPNTPLPYSNHYINNLNHHITHHPTPSSNFRGSTTLQDFFTGSDSTPPLVAASRNFDNHGSKDIGGPETALQLFQDFQPQQCTSGLPAPFSAVGGFDGLASAALGGGGPSKKRVFDDEAEENGGGDGDRRRQRMIKNRESAARSRARKQAYITELELELAHLAEENARLRKQHLQLIEAPPTQMPKKHGLYRTSTAPF